MLSGPPVPSPWPLMTPASDQSLPPGPSCPLAQIMRLLSCLFPFSGFPPADLSDGLGALPRCLPSAQPVPPSAAAGTGGIHPPVSSRKEAGQPSTQPSAPGGSSCGGSSGSPPTLLSGMASPQVGKLRLSRSQGPQFLPTASSAALPAQIRQPGPLLWAPPLGSPALCHPEPASRCPSTSRPVFTTPDPCRGSQSPRAAPRPPQGPQESNVGCGGRWSQTPGLWSSRRGGLSESGKLWAGQGCPLPAPHKHSLS